MSMDKENLKDLYLAKSKNIRELNEMISLPDAKNLKLLLKSGDKLYTEGNKLMAEGDEEKAYVILMRYLNCNRHIQKFPEYLKHKAYFDKMMGASRANSKKPVRENVESIKTLRFEEQSQATLDSAKEHQPTEKKNLTVKDHLNQNVTNRRFREQKKDNDQEEDKMTSKSNLKSPPINLICGQQSNQTSSSSSSSTHPSETLLSLPHNQETQSVDPNDLYTLTFPDNDTYEIKPPKNREKSADDNKEVPYWILMLQNENDALVKLLKVKEKKIEALEKQIAEKSQGNSQALKDPKENPNEGTNSNPKKFFEVFLSVVCLYVLYCHIQLQQSEFSR